MIHKVKVAVCSDIHTKRSTQSEHHVEFLNVKPWWYVKKLLGFKRLNNMIYTHKAPSLNGFKTAEHTLLLLLLLLLHKPIKNSSTSSVLIFFLALQCEFPGYLYSL